MSTWTVEILGEPVGEGRPRAVRMGAGVRMHAAPKSAQWRALAAQQMAAQWRQDAVDDVCSVSVVALMPRPASLPKRVGTSRLRRAVKPDVDNLAKASLDALVQAGVLADDRCVCTLVVDKMTCAVGEAPRTVVTVLWGPVP